MIVLSSPFIVIDEISQKLNELNSSISSTLSTINTNVSSIKTDISSVKSVCDNIYAKVDTEIESVLTNTNTNNTANLTGTLSQKLSYIANNLVGAVNQTGGTYNSGTVNAKLATILLNMNSTTFTAGTNITKYNPITSTTLFSPTSNKISYNGADFYLSDKIGKYNFKANRDGTVRITITTTNIYGCNRFIIAKDSAYNDIVYYYSENINNTTETIDFNVENGTTYYLDFLFCSRSHDTECTQLKVSYNININASLI